MPTVPFRIRLGSQDKVIGVQVTDFQLSVYAHSSTPRPWIFRAPIFNATFGSIRYEGQVLDDAALADLDFGMYDIRVDFIGGSKRAITYFPILEWGLEVVDRKGRDIWHFGISGLKDREGFEAIVGTGLAWSRDYNPVPRIKAGMETKVGLNKLAFKHDLAWCFLADNPLWIVVDRGKGALKTAEGPKGREGPVSQVGNDVLIANRGIAPAFLEVKIAIARNILQYAQTDEERKRFPVERWMKGEIPLPSDTEVYNVYKGILPQREGFSIQQLLQPRDYRATSPEPAKDVGMDGGEYQIYTNRLLRIRQRVTITGHGGSNVDRAAAGEICNRARNNYATEGRINEI